MFIIYSLCLLFFFYRRSCVFMHFFQQEEYDNKRFINFILKDFNLLDKKLSLIIIILFFYAFFEKKLQIHLALLSLLLVIFGLLQKNPIKVAKKLLVITARVKRLFIALLSIFSVYLYCLHDFTIYIFYLLNIALIQAIPLMLVLANILLYPFEKRINNKYLKEAKEKIKQINPIIIGITGSYGKTSTKHILYHILSSIAPTLSTPGNVNTPMGITKIIREKLKPEHKYFIVEMGAYGKDSIKRLCDLTPPHHGIITAIGHAHFERFKNINTVAQAKFELANAVTYGFVIVNGDAINNDLLLKYGNKTTVVHSHDIKQNNNGLQFDLHFEDQTHTIALPLFGTHHASNASLCFALLYKMGINTDTITAALKSTPQIQHRLEVMANKTGSIIIDDAYNSNPTGFTAALDVLKLLKKKDGRVIIVTPGMVELGDLHDEKHFEVGVKSAEIADYVLVILPNRIKSFIQGFNSIAKSTQKLLTFDSFSTAKKWVDANLQQDDVILYENDLPDLYESKVSF